MSVIERYLNEESRGEVLSSPQGTQIAVKEKTQIERTKNLSKRIEDRQIERIHDRAQQDKDRLQDQSTKEKEIADARAKQEEKRAKTALPTLTRR